MIFKRLNRTAAESVFAVFKANESGISANDVVVLVTGATADGVAVAQNITSTIPATVGVADAAIANGAYGLVQVYGYRSASRIETSGATLTAGATLYPKASTDVLLTLANPTGVLPSFVLLETGASTSSATTELSEKIFIRCM